MKKIGGQKELVEGNLPELEDKEVAKKLERIWKLREGAKMHDKLSSEVKTKGGKKVRVKLAPDKEDDK